MSFCSEQFSEPIFSIYIKFSSFFVSAQKFYLEILFWHCVQRSFGKCLKKYEIFRILAYGSALNVLIVGILWDILCTTELDTLQDQMRSSTLYNKKLFLGHNCPNIVFSVISSNIIFEYLNTYKFKLFWKLLGKNALINKFSVCI